MPAPRDTISLLASLPLALTCSHPTPHSSWGPLRPTLHLATFLPGLRGLRKATLRSGLQARPPAPQRPPASCTAGHGQGAILLVLAVLPIVTGPAFTHVTPRGAGAVHTG